MLRSEPQLQNICTSTVLNVNLHTLLLALPFSLVAHLLYLI